MLRSALTALCLMTLATPAMAQTIRPGTLQKAPPVRPGPILPPACTATPASLSDGVYSLRLAGGGRALDAENYGTWSDGARVLAWDFHGGPNQLWLLKRQSDGSYFIRSAKTARGLQGATRCTPPNCAVTTERANPANAGMRFRIDDIGGGRHRLRLNDRLQLSVEGARNNGDAAKMMPVGCGAHQAFELRKWGDFHEVSREAGVGRVMSIDVRLNNYTPRKNEFDGSGERAFFKPDDGAITFNFSGARPLRSAVALPVLEIGPNRMFKTYINDWNSSGTQISGDNGRLRIRVGFEDAGTEIITNCYNNLNCHVGEPRFDLRDSSLTVLITPQWDERRSVWGFTNETTFNARVSESGPCVNNFWAFLCDLFAPGRETLIRDNVVNVVNAQLGSDDRGNPRLGRIGLEGVLNALAGGTRFRRITVGQDGELIFY